MTPDERYDAWLAMWRRLGMIVVIERADRPPQGFYISRADKYKRGEVEASDGWRLFRDGGGKL